MVLARKAQSQSFAEKMRGDRLNRDRGHVVRASRRLLSSMRPANLRRGFQSDKPSGLSLLDSPQLMTDSISREMSTAHHIDVYHDPSRSALAILGTYSLRPPVAVARVCD